MRGRKARIPVAARKVVAYCRVSSTEQAENGHSLEAQQNRLAAYATGTEREIAGFYVDAGVSAGTMKRPELQRLLTDISSGQIACVMVTKLDRLSRSLRDLLDIVELCKKKDVALVSASESLDTSTAMGRAMLHLLGTFAELELAKIGERTADVLADRRRQGKVYSRSIPFGYERRGDALVKNEEQQRALTMAREMSSSGASLRQIAVRLESMNVRPQGGGKWYAASVRAILNSKMTAQTA